jgi:Spy/CpxP family protein refolding chaperone
MKPISTACLVLATALFGAPALAQTSTVNQDPATSVARPPKHPGHVAPATNGFKDKTLPDSKQETPTSSKPK